MPQCIKTEEPQKVALRAERQNGIKDNNVHQQIAQREKRQNIIKRN